MGVNLKCGRCERNLELSAVFLYWPSAIEVSKIKPFCITRSPVQTRHKTSRFNTTRYVPTRQCKSSSLSIKEHERVRFIVKTPEAKAAQNLKSGKSLNSILLRLCITWSAISNVVTTTKCGHFKGNYNLPLKGLMSWSPYRAICCFLF